MFLSQKNLVETYWNRLKNHGISRLVIWRSQNCAKTESNASLLEGPMILITSRIGWMFTPCASEKKTTTHDRDWLVVSTLLKKLKNISQIGSFPQIRNHHLGDVIEDDCFLDIKRAKNRFLHLSASCHDSLETQNGMSWAPPATPNSH